ncbi:MAG: 5-(carboxyamino)imidazole ribonucleotide synthase [Oscillospiraceae bacterium]|nr:5-(carboxyamino)imidazole ribonucleotide synthase [Oscillospiraceae bacterium]
MDILKKKIGIVGGGQLGKMMILEAKRLGFYVAVLDPAADCPSQSICDKLIVSPLDDPSGYIELSKHTDVITYEWELINADALENLEKEGQTVYPSVRSLRKIQNKYIQNSEMQSNNIPVPRFALVSTTEEIREYGKSTNFGYPLMLKTTTGGYDGKGVAPIKTEADIESAFNELGSGVKELMVEEFVGFQKEISVIASRGITGEMVVYPVAENTHTNTILDTTVVPADISDEISNKAAEIANRVMSVFEGVGTFCTEMFLTADGNIFVNEVAPRPHNSGHYTIEGCFANQFENHIRAIVGLPFGDTSLISPTVMVNLIGQSDGTARLLGLEESYKDPNVHVHVYGKSESKTGRKMGHFTVTGNTADDAVKRADKLKQVLRFIGE